MRFCVGRYSGSAEEKAYRRRGGAGQSVRTLGPAAFVRPIESVLRVCTLRGNLIILKFVIIFIFVCQSAQVMQDSDGTVARKVAASVGLFTMGVFHLESGSK
jgi:hypothetical protein